MTVETLGLAALFALCDELKDIVSSPTLAPVHSLQLSSDADLLRCFRSDEHLDSRVSLDFSKNRNLQEKEFKYLMEASCLIKTFCVFELALQDVHKCNP